MKGPLESAARAAKGRKTSRRKSAQSMLPKVPGGKALARIHLFRAQREMNETASAKAPAKRQGMLLVVATAAKSKSRSRNGSAGRGGKSGKALYVQAFEKLTQMATPPTHPAAAAIVAVGWRPLGPFFVPHGQTYGSGPGSRPSVSGRVSAVAIDPGDPQHILIGAAGGGVWETRDTGGSWHPRSDDAPSLSIGAVVFDPTNPSIAYAGTGEGDSRSPLGVGLLRSTNGGTTWTVHAQAPFERVAFFDLLVDITDGNHILAATTSGLYRSTDGGSSWSRRRSAITYDLSMAVAADGSREFLAACSDGLFVSTSGSGWSAVSLPNRPNTFGRLEIAHAPSDGNIAYAFGVNQLADGSNTQGFLWRRGSASGSFSSEPLPPGLEVGQGWYDWFAAVAPNNPGIVYLGAINAHRGVRSTSGSWSWTNISAKHSADSIHPDQHAIAFNPTDPNDVFIGNDGGVYRSTDGGVHWTSLNKGLCITEFEFLAQHPEHESWLIAGTQDNGTLRYQGQQVWYLVQDGDGGDCGVNATNPTNCFHSFYGMYLERSDEGGAWNTWTDTELPFIDNLEGLFYPPAEVNGNVVAKAGRRVYISRNNGDPGSWKFKSLPGSSVGSALAVPSADLVYVGTDDGDVLGMTFSGTNWSSPTALTRPRSGFVSDLLVDPTNGQRIWATYSSFQGGHVFRSDDGGTTWNDVSQGLPSIPVNAIELDPANTDTVFVAADVGVYRSDDAGQTWHAFSRHLPNALVKDLLFHAPSRMLRAATQSRGVWEIPIDANSVPAVDVYIRDNVIDSGRLVPSPSGIDDPFDVGQHVFWWQSPDIKIDAPSYLSPNLDALGFDLFEDDQSMREDGIEFASGLLNEQPQRNNPARVYVQLHNRGVQPAMNVDVRVFFTNSGTTLPDLPDGFWTNFPANTVPDGHPWQPVAAHQTIPHIDPGRSEIVGFEWQVPGNLASNVSMLAVASAQNDSIATQERVIHVLVPDEKKCALKSVAVVNPPMASGPPLMAVPIQMAKIGSETINLRLEGRGPRLIRALILPKGLKAKAGPSLKRVKLSAEDKEQLQRVIAHHPELAKTMDLRAAYSSRRALWLEAVELAKLKQPTIIALMNPRPKSARQSLVVERAAGGVIGGFTFRAE